MIYKYVNLRPSVVDDYKLILTYMWRELVHGKTLALVPVNLANRQSLQGACKRSAEHMARILRQYLALTLQTSLARFSHD